MLSALRLNADIRCGRSFSLGSPMNSGRCCPFNARARRVISLRTAARAYRHRIGTEVSASAVPSPGAVRLRPGSGRQAQRSWGRDIPASNDSDPVRKDLLRFCSSLPQPFSASGFATLILRCESGRCHHTQMACSNSRERKAISIAKFIRSERTKPSRPGNKEAPVTLA